MTTLNLTELRTAVTKAADPDGAQKALTGALKACEIIAKSGVKEHFDQQKSPDGESWRPLSRPRVDGGNKVLRDKGTLYNSISTLVTAQQIIMVASHPAANVHQFGATITPRIARALAIPLSVEAKRVGSPRRNHFPRPLFVLSTDRAAFLAERKGGTRLVLHYVLKRSVRIPARPFLGFSERTLAKMERIIADRLGGHLLDQFESGLRIML